MYYVGCFRPNGSEILGTGSGQGFFNYKRLSSVVKILREYHVGKHEIYHGVSHIIIPFFKTNNFTHLQHLILLFAPKAIITTVIHKTNNITSFVRHNAVDVTWIFPSVVVMEPLLHNTSN